MKKNKFRNELEFIALMAFLMSNVALSIDAILPGLTAIGYTLNNSEESSLQLLITMIFLGLGIGELFFGTLSDSFGRKPVIYAGMGVFILASIICVTASGLEVMLLGRFLQGFGLSTARTVSISMIRDTFSGEKMARVMSFISAIFILVPMIAPILGQAILAISNWQSIFYFQLIFATVTLVWFYFRQEETLPQINRIQFSNTSIVDGIVEYVRFKETVMYTIISGLIEGAFILYLSTSKQIFQDQYGLSKEFPFIFAAISFVLGIATFLNGSLVTRSGMRKLTSWSLYLYTSTSAAYLFIFSSSVNPGLSYLLFFLFLQFFYLGFIFGNLGALAMQPIGHIAGVGAAVFSFTSMVLAAPLAMIAGIFVIDTVKPLFVIFFFSGGLSLILMKLITRRDTSKRHQKC